MKHILIDTDPGVDDAIAILLALNSPELQVEGLTIVSGNVNLELGSMNALKLLEFTDTNDVSVALGASKPLLRSNRDASNIHGNTGLGEVILPDPKKKLDERSAVELMIDKIDEIGKDLIIVPIGPLTNIANLLQVRPNVVEEISGLVMMGGAYNLTPYGHGNVTPVAEFNVWHDPEAAKIVFDSAISITAIGLDVTTAPSNRLSKEKFSEIQALDTERALFIVNLCKNIVNKYGGVSIHDPLAVATVINPCILETKNVEVQVETMGKITRGMTVVDHRYRNLDSIESNINVGVSVNSHQFLELFFDRVVLM
jgi:inosine-uridine nucleoside N-ribohydrolase